MQRGSRIFVSGGAGVIGRSLVERLYEGGASLWVGDLKPRPSGWPTDIHYRQGDLATAPAAYFEQAAPEFFFHLAASFERSNESAAFWEPGARHNIELSHSLMSRLKDLPSLRRVVFASSYLIYDPALYHSRAPAQRARLLHERDPISPRNLCGSAKHHHELELSFLEQYLGDRFSSVSARIFRSYGKGSGDVISRWVRSALAGEALDVYGQDGMFDYVYAEDVAEGLLRLAESDATGVVNLGTGRPRRVREIVDILRANFPDLRVRESVGDPSQDSGDGRCEASGADVRRLEQVTRWRPRIPVEEAIGELIDFERRRLQLGQPGPAREPARPNALVFSAAAKAPLLEAVRNSLLLCGEGELHAADSDPNALARHLADHFWCCPSLEELSVEGLIAECHRRRVGVLFPTRDGELAWFARRREELAAAGVQVMVSPEASITDCLDKLRFASRLALGGIAHVATCERVEDVVGARIVVKERVGSGSRGVHCDVSPEEARTLAKEMRAPIFQPFVPGPEYSVDVYLAKTSGKALGAVCRSRDLVRGGESQVTTTANLPELEDLCLRAAYTLGLRGHATFQALWVSGSQRGAHGGFLLLECNPRFGGASTLSVAAGLDSFSWFLAEASGQTPAPWQRAPEPLRLVRRAVDSIAP